MAKRELQQKAVSLRLKGKSYSEIKKELGVPKGTLSGWLEKYPLSPEQLRSLRDFNPRRIENFRATMRRKKEERLEGVYKRVAKDISRLSDRDLLLGGFFLYWGEGSKTTLGSVAVTNTNPSILLYFIKWIELFGYKRSELKVNLHVYQDMNVKKETLYWSNMLRISKESFRKPSIKRSNIKDLTYKNGYGHGTCQVRLERNQAYEYVMMGLKFLQNSLARL